MSIDREKKNAWYREWYQDNKDEVQARNTEWREANRDKVNAAAKAWRYANQEKRAAQLRAFRLKHKERLSREHKEWYQANKERERARAKVLSRKPARKRSLAAWQMQKKYGVSRERFEQMLVESCGRCNICMQFFKNCKIEPSIDHCHSTGNVRGLLCDGCNHGLGRFKDSTEFLQSAIAYLLRHKKE